MATRPRRSRFTTPLTRVRRAGRVEWAGDDSEHRLDEYVRAADVHRRSAAEPESDLCLRDRVRNPDRDHVVGRGARDPGQPVRARRGRRSLCGSTGLVTTAGGRGVLVQGGLPDRIPACRERVANLVPRPDRGHDRRRPGRHDQLAWSGHDHARTTQAERSERKRLRDRRGPVLGADVGARGDLHGRGALRAAEDGISCSLRERSTSRTRMGPSLPRAPRIHPWVS